MELLICTHDPMLIKGLCNSLRDAGYSVTTADHAASAIKLLMERQFGTVVLDSYIVGLGVAEAIPVIRHVSPDIKVVVIGDAPSGHGVWTVSRPTSLEELRGIIFRISGKGSNAEAKERV